MKTIVQTKIATLYYNREDGPAVEYADGSKEWCYNGKYFGSYDDFTNESWKTFIKTLIFS